MTITAIATGSANPVQVMSPTYTSCMNGSFLITDSSGLTRKIGDGLDEATSWTLDFTQHGNFASFSTTAPLVSALLTLTLTPVTSLSTDAFWLEGYGYAGTTEIQPLGPSSGTTTLQIQLLNYYSSAIILQSYTQGTLGKISCMYSDDAIVSYARLELVNAVPEPQSILLLALSIVFCYRRKK